MSLTKKFAFKPKTFGVGELRRGLESLRDTILLGSVLQVSIFRTLEDGTRHSESNLEVSALDVVCDLSGESSYKVGIGQKAETLGLYPVHLSLWISPEPDGFFEIRAECELPEILNALQSELAKKLVLDGAPLYADRLEAARVNSKIIPLPKQIAELNNRILILEQAQTTTRSLTCFLSYQFKDSSEEYGQRVKEFLELLNVQVITGKGYEPRPVNEKVKGRLAEKLDFVVVIEALSGKSSWTRDEIARAQSPDIFLIPLVEKGATFDKGIFGEHEYINFEPGHIGDAFIGLLEGVYYIRRIVRDVDSKPEVPEA